MDWQQNLDQTGLNQSLLLPPTQGKGGGGGAHPIQSYPASQNDGTIQQTISNPQSNHWRGEGVYGWIEQTRGVRKKMLCSVSDKKTR